MNRQLELTRAVLRRFALPQPDENSDKDGRGRVLVVGGCAQVPGAMLLAGVAALRAGAGKLQLATVSPAATALGIAVPEALVLALPQGRSGEIAGARVGAVLRDRVQDVDALLVGPGMTSDRVAHAVVAQLVGRMNTDATLLLDAAAILALRHDEAMLHALTGRAVLTPHAGEMATLLGIDRSDVEADARSAAQVAAARFGAMVVLKGANSWIAEPNETLYHFEGGSVGLATSGSGDTLAGIVAGLAARGATAMQATLWGVYLHAAAGQALAKRVGKIGFLARELLDEIPKIMNGMRPR